MTDIPGIQISSGFARNSPGPLDLKTNLTTSERLSLTSVQRWLGMIVYDNELGKWKKLTTNPATDTTTESDWIDFISSGGVDWTVDQGGSEYIHYNNINKIDGGSF